MSFGAPASALSIPTSATPPAVLTMGGGAAADTAANRWTGVGIFKRVNIDPANNSYNRGSGRTDCVAATCTYTEEIQNCANWYTYYRTRMLMMKSARPWPSVQLEPQLPRRLRQHLPGNRHDRG